MIICVYHLFYVGIIVSPATTGQFFWAILPELTPSLAGPTYALRYLAREIIYSAPSFCGVYDHTKILWYICQMHI